MRFAHEIRFRRMKCLWALGNLFIIVDVGRGLAPAVFFAHEIRFRRMKCLRALGILFIIVDFVIVGRGLAPAVFSISDICFRAGKPPHYGFLLPLMKIYSVVFV